MLTAPRNTILDLFSQISNDRIAEEPTLCIKLWNHLNSLSGETCEVDENNIPKEIIYTIQRLIQGLGSSRAPVRKSYFATLVLLLSRTISSFGTISLNNFKEIVDKTLSKCESKGEEGEVFTGKILAYGVSMRSGIFFAGSADLQKEILLDIFTKSKQRSYLPLLAYTFVTDFLKTIDENVFKTVVWPILMNEVLVNWPSQTLDTLYCLLEVQNKYPSILTKNLILSTFNAPSIFHESTVEQIEKMMTDITWEPWLKHPIYEIIGQNLIVVDDNMKVLNKFWEYVEEDLKNSPTRLKLLAIFTIFVSIVKTLHLQYLPSLLTSTFVENLINSCQSLINKKDQLCLAARNTLRNIVLKVTEKTGETSPVIYNILCKLIFECGQILIDKVTGVKVVVPFVSRLDAKHIKLLAKKCEHIVLMRSKKKVEMNLRLNFRDRCYATQLLARLVSHPESQDMDWKIKHLKLMMKYALFYIKSEDKVQISSELAAVLKKSFFTALSHQLSHLENHRMVLISLVYYIDTILANGQYELRTKLSDEMLNCWRDMMSKIQKIDLIINKTGKRKTAMYIFHTLFLQMALHMFVDPILARNILNELDRCYEKEKTQLKNNKRKANTEESDFEWIEIAIDLFLSLLSHDTHLLRQLISRIFPHLCPHLTAQATFQILQVFDIDSSMNILTEEGEESDDKEESDIEVDDSNDDTICMDNDTEEESDSDIEDIENAEETAVERTRQAVQDALGMAGSVTDTESIDLDDIDEEEGRKLDAALSQAFKNVRKSQRSRNKKQSPSDKALTNFRIRVLDLVDIYLDNNPSLSLVLDTIPTLFKLLEFTIKDSYQKPLESRTRSTIKKIGHLKKCSNIEGIDNQTLVDVLKFLMEKGVRSTPIFLDLCNDMSECCTFLLRMHVQHTNNTNKKKSVIFNLCITAVDNFFLRRDCLLPISLFENILFKTNWIMNVNLCQRIAELSFDVAVRGFRRNQGLSLLNCFYRNTRLLMTIRESKPADCLNLENTILYNAIKVLKPRNEANESIKPSFVSELFLLLFTMRNSKCVVKNSNWKLLSEMIKSFLSDGASSLNGSKKYIDKLCSSLNINVTKKRGETSIKTKKIHCDHQSPTNVFIKGASSNENNIQDSDGEVGDVNMVVHEGYNDTRFHNKNVMKKSKRKYKESEEYVNAKRLRNEIANDAEVLKFSEMNLPES